MISKYFVDLGVKTEKVEKGIRLTKTGQYASRINLDLTEQPDMTQTLVLSCLLNDIPFEFSGLQSLKIKETDRISALINESAKLGFLIRESDGNKLIWDKERCEAKNDISIDTYDDHRMAMSFSAASLKYQGIMINNPEVVSKSYPDFWKDLEKAGFMTEPV
jgi:3-phosphoshikimate 1-carboxyvinyltransferase